MFQASGAEGATESEFTLVPATDAPNRYGLMRQVARLLPSVPYCQCSILIDTKRLKKHATSMDESSLLAEETKRRHRFFT